MAVVASVDSVRLDERFRSILNTVLGSLQCQSYRETRGGNLDDIAMFNQHYETLQCTFFDKV